MNIFKRIYNEIADKLYGKQLSDNTLVMSEIFEMAMKQYKTRKYYLPNICNITVYKGGINFEFKLDSTKFANKDISLHIYYKSIGPTSIILKNDKTYLYHTCINRAGNLYINYFEGTKEINEIWINRNSAYDFIQFFISEYKKLMRSMPNKSSNSIYYNKYNVTQSNRK